MKAAAFYSESMRPALQAQNLLRHFISGKPMQHSRLFRQMSPLSNDVWELRSDDLRFFGWFHRKDCYVAVSGDLFENLKADKSLYEMHRIKAVKARDALNLNDPKHLQGAGRHDVLSE